MDLSTDLILLLKFDDLGVFGFGSSLDLVEVLPCICLHFQHWRKVVFASLRVKRGAQAPETEEELPRRDIILSLTPTVFTASADLEGLLQRVCVWECVCEWLLQQVVFIFMVSR